MELEGHTLGGFVEWEGGLKSFYEGREASVQVVSKERDLEH